MHVKGKEALAAVGDESGVRVLIVDNDPEFRRYLKTLLTKHDYYVLTRGHRRRRAGCGAPLSPAGTGHVDLALPQRPGAELGDGADLVAQLQTGALIREIYCFMVTGYDPAEVRERLWRFCKLRRRSGRSPWRARNSWPGSIRSCAARRRPPRRRQVRRHEGRRRH